MKRKEIVIQKDVADCGPCCLLSIIKHYGGYVPLEKIKLDTYASNGGTSAYNLIQAAFKYGFEATGVKCDKLETISIYPCIAHVILENGFNHYVVIYKQFKDKVIIMDPAKGKITMLKQDFFKIWDNIIIEFHPKQKIIKYPVQKNIIYLFITLLKEYKLNYITIIILSIIITLLNLFFSFYLKIGDYLTHQNILFFIYFTIISFICITLKNTLFLLYNNKYVKLNNKISKKLTSDFMFHIFSLPSNILQSKTSGDIITRINDLSDVKDFLSEIVIGIILDGLVVINGGIILFILNQEMALISFLILTIYFFISLIFSKKSTSKIYKWLTKNTEYNEKVLDSINMVSSINNLQIKELVSLHLDYQLINKLNEDRKMKNHFNIINTLKSYINDIALLAINILALIKILNKSLSMIDYITFNTIYLYVFGSFYNILNILPEYYYLKGTIYKISEFKNLPIEDNKGILSFKYNDIRVKNLSYSYNYKTIINHLSFNLKTGKSYFIKGISGCGKSTLMKILYKDILEYDGDIYLGESNYKDLDVKSVKENISIATQNDRLFSGTIYDNIKCLRDVSEKEFAKVCKICLVDKVVKKKKLRYYCNINDELTNISGGEKQQIILARNLLKNGKIIIIDEALSEVDKKTERMIINNIKRSYVNSIIIYISHKNMQYLFDECIEIIPNKEV